MLDDKKTEYHFTSDKGENINVEFDENEVKITKDGIEQTYQEKLRKKRLNMIPYPMIVVVAYLLLGCIWDLWHPAWLLFLTIPLFYSIINLNKNEIFSHLPVPMLCVVAFLVLGIIFDLWAWCWMVLLVIPLYYAIDKMIHNKKWLKSVYPLLCVIIFLILGFALDAWHPAWIIFLTIPIVSSFVDITKVK